MSRKRKKNNTSLIKNTCVISFADRNKLEARKRLIQEKLFLFHTTGEIDLDAVAEIKFTDLCEDSLINFERFKYLIMLLLQLDMLEWPRHENLKHITKWLKEQQEEREFSKRMMEEYLLEQKIFHQAMVQNEPQNS